MVKQTATVTDTDDFKSKYEEVQKQNNFLLDQVTTLQKGASAEQVMKEYALKMLWIMYRMPKCGATKDIGKALPKFREWVGEDRAAELETAWRKGIA